jgi:hypothetical protein
VFIDGIPQLEKPHTLKKPAAFQHVPKVPDFTKEAHDAITYDGLPPLTSSFTTSDTVVFRNVKSVYSRSGDAVAASFLAQGENDYGVVIVRNGKTVCTGKESICLTSSVLDDAEITYVDLKGGQCHLSIEYRCLLS